MKTKIIFLISAFFILKTPSFSQSGLQKSKSIGANLSQYSGSPESVATKLYGEKLILTDVDWFRFVIDQADKNLDKNYKEKGYGEFLFSYNNASVKGLRSRAILYQNKKKEYRLFISVPLKHHKSLNQNLANEIFTFQSLMDEFDRLSCGEKFISFLWISYGNFDYITELNPAKKNENTFVVTSDVFSNEGRVEMHSE